MPSACPTFTMIRDGCAHHLSSPSCPSTFSASCFGQPPPACRGSKGWQPGSESSLADPVSSCPQSCADQPLVSSALPVVLWRSVRVHWVIALMHRGAVLQVGFIPPTMRPVRSESATTPPPATHADEHRGHSSSDWPAADARHVRCGRERLVRVRRGHGLVGPRVQHVRRRLVRTAGRTGRARPAWAARARALLDGRGPRAAPARLATLARPARPARRRACTAYARTDWRATARAPRRGPGPPARTAAASPRGRTAVRRPTILARPAARARTASTAPARASRARAKATGPARTVRRARWAGTVPTARTAALRAQPTAFVPKDRRAAARATPAGRAPSALRARRATAGPSARRVRAAPAPASAAARRQHRAQARRTTRASTASTATKTSRSATVLKRSPSQRGRRAARRWTARCSASAGKCPWPPTRRCAACSAGTTTRSSRCATLAATSRWTTCRRGSSATAAALRPSRACACRRCRRSPPAASRCLRWSAQLRDVSRIQAA